MNILGVETSCDETALALLACEGGQENPHFKIIAEAVHSQIHIHQKYGGVFPMMAKREHAKNLIPLFKKLLEESKFLNSIIKNQNAVLQIKNKKRIASILSRELELCKQFLKFIPIIEKPPIEVIAVTHGPGLEPALWVGINFAKALGEYWNIPVIPINHMEGHIVSVLAESTETAENRRTDAEKRGSKTSYPQRTIHFPALALLISGGHTELVLIRDWLEYEIIGETRDDAVGEAFDKVARILGLPYPGGPEISHLAEEARSSKLEAISFPLPRPMLHSKDYDFSFSGLKTAVLYMVKKMPRLTDEIKRTIAQEFEDAVTEVLVDKTKRALKMYGSKTLIVAGGVSANRHIREVFAQETKRLTIPLLIPNPLLSTDNAVMIAAAGYLRFVNDPTEHSWEKSSRIAAHGQLPLSTTPC